MVLPAWCVKMWFGGDNQAGFFIAVATVGHLVLLV